MIKRNITEELKTLAVEFPVVAILGPRQSGKTTISKAVFKDYKYISLENPEERIEVKRDPMGFLKKYNEYVIIDEIQRVPELLSYLQTHVDEKNKEGMYIITGSHNYLLMEKVSQSLAGRVGIATLLPLSTDEIKNHFSDVELDEIIFKGGFPRIYDKDIRPPVFYESLLNTYIERDVRLLKNITDHELFVRFLKIIAGRTGQILNTQAISEECGISNQTVNEWISVLITSYIIFKLAPFHKNYNKRIIKSPKIYFFDTGLACYLLGIKSLQNLSTHYLKGNIFETFIISNFYKINYNHAKLCNFYFWRDNHGKEIDLIIEDGLKIKPVEIKSGYTFHTDFITGLEYWNKLSNNNPENAYLIYGGEENKFFKSTRIIPWHEMKKIME